MSNLVGSNGAVHVGFIVKDIYETRKKWAQFLGVEEPEISDSGEFDIVQTEYMGQPAPGAKALLTFFDFPGFRIELIQPSEEPSTWREFLETHGEGVHHLAFEVNGMKMVQAIDACEKFGMKLTQRGEYSNGAGRYAYVDSEDLKVAFELLEDDPADRKSVV